MLSIHYLEKKGDAVYIGRQILKRRNVKNYSETNWIGGREAKAASTQSFSCRRIKHLFLQWLTLKRVKVWKDYRKSSSTGSICCRTFCKAIHRFSLEKKGGWIPDSPAIISTPLHLTVAGTMQHTTNGVLPVNATWSSSASKGGKIGPAPTPSTLFFRHRHSYQHFTEMPRLIYHQLGSVWNSQISSLS